MISDQVGDYLQRFFPQFEPALQKMISENGSIRTVSAGETLMDAGQYFRFSALIVEGRIKLFRPGEEGEEFFMYYLKPGEACALSMICASRQETSEIIAKAVEDTTVLTLPVSMMDELMKNYQTWYYFVLETYRRRFEELLMVIDSVAFKALDERLIFYLKRQVKELGTTHLNLTHQEIATDLNSSREVISRLLKKLEQKGILKLDRSFIKWTANS